MSQRCTTTMCLKFLSGPADHDLEAEVEDTLEDEFPRGRKVLGVDLPQDAFVVD